MLRQYLIVNGIATVLLYGAYASLVPSTPHLLQSVWESFDAFAMESPLLGPVVYRLVTVSGR